METTAVENVQNISEVDTVRELLEQALTSLDNALLDRVFTVQDNSLMQDTLLNLKTSLILPLLKVIQERLEEHPGSCRVLLPWLRNILLIHGPSIQNIPDSLETVSKLQAWLDDYNQRKAMLEETMGRIEAFIERENLRVKCSKCVSGLPVLGDEKVGRLVSVPAAVYDEEFSDDGGDGEEKVVELMETDSEEDVSEVEDDANQSEDNE